MDRDEGTNVITKFSPDGSKVLMVLGHRPSVLDGLVATRHGPNPPERNTRFAGRRTCLGPAGRHIRSDGYCNNRVVKYDRNGRFLAEVGAWRRAKRWTNSTCRTRFRWTMRGMCMSQTVPTTAM